MAVIIGFCYRKNLKKRSLKFKFPIICDHWGPLGFFLSTMGLPLSVLSTVTMVQVSRKNIDHKWSYDHSYTLRLKESFFRKEAFLIKFCIKLHNIRATNCVHMYILHDTNI